MKNTALLFAISTTLGVSSVSAYNFWLAEVLDGNGSVGRGGSGNSGDLLFCTQDGTEPGCVQIGSARDASAYPPPNFFQSVACGITLNFYQSGSDYIYYQNDGNGQALGACVPDNGATYYCMTVLGLGSETVNGRYGCTNYEQVVNGINPCQN